MSAGGYPSSGHSKTPSGLFPANPVTSRLPASSSTRQEPANAETDNSRVAACDALTARANRSGWSRSERSTSTAVPWPAPLAELSQVSGPLRRAAASASSFVVAGFVRPQQQRVRRVLTVFSRSRHPRVSMASKRPGRPVDVRSRGSEMRRWGSAVPADTDLAGLSAWVAV